MLRPGCVELVERKPPKLAAIALANKNARVVWKLMVSGERYNPARVGWPWLGPARGAALRVVGLRAAPLAPHRASSCLGRWLP